MVPRGGPERLQWAVDRLRLNPQAHVLEVGCGDGRALELVCDRLVEGRAVGVDRSRTAIDRARPRLADQLASGRVELRHADLDTVELPAGAFDTVLAVNVNRFWTRDAVPVLATLSRALRPGGELHLVWEPPAGAGAARIAKAVGAAMDTAGFTVTIATATLAAPPGAEPSNIVDVSGSTGSRRGQRRRKT